MCFDAGAQTTPISTGPMQNDNDNAVYNARIRDMRASSSRIPCACLLLVILTQTTVLSASDWRSPEEQLARKIVAVTGPGAVAIDFVNKSSLDGPDVESIQRGLLNELVSLGVLSVSPDRAVATVRVTLSENLQSYVWVAEIQQGGESSVVMVATPRQGSAAVERPASAVMIHKTLLWTDENRILDVALLNGNPQRMIVLEAENVVLAKLQDGRWQHEQSLPILHTHSWPRDLRGRLALRKDHLFDVYLPGVFCRSNNAAPLAVVCYDSDDPWPLGSDQSGLSGFFAPTRNFFTGALSPGIEKQTTLKPFYSAAMLPRDKYRLWVFSTVDGQIHFLDGVTDQTVAKLSWGSDLASVRSGCGLGWQVLVTGNGAGEGETVQAFELADREAVAVSQAVEFGNGLTALWTDSNGTGAIAVLQNQETAKYEAYRLSITCNQ